MSNLPSFLPAKNPHQAVLTNGDPYPLTPVEVTTLIKDITALHFRPQIVVAPSNYHVKDGSTLASDIFASWKLGPHSLLVVYSPADKNVWVQCGAFNSSAGVDSTFFKHDFLQRMSGSNQDGNLAAALTASLKDVDQIIVRSQAFAAAQVNRQTSEVQPRHPVHTGHHAGHGGAATLMQILPAVLLALVVLNFIGRSLAKAAPRRRFDDLDDKAPDLTDDVDRILKVIHHTDGGASSSAYGGAFKPRNTQVPMAEFKKRAESPVKVSAHGAGAARISAFGANAGRLDDPSTAFGNTSQQRDHASELPTAIDSLAANVRREHKEKISSGAYSSYGSPGEAPPAVVQDGKFIDSYVASFNTESGSQNETSAPAIASPAVTTPASVVPVAPSAASAPAPALSSDSTFASPVPAFPVSTASTFSTPSLPSPSSYPSPSPSSPPSPSPSLFTVTPAAASAANLSSLPSEVSSAANVPTSPAPNTSGVSNSSNTPGSSFDLSSYSLQAASAPFADVLSSMGSNLGDMKTSSGGSLPLGSLASFDTNRDTSKLQADCPKCSEPRSKDFSFCLKCGFNF